MDSTDENQGEAAEATVPWQVEDGNSGSLYTALDDAKSEICLLYINETPCCSQAMLCCDLYKVSLDDNPEFAALSYCWGDEKDTVEVCLAGRMVPVTKNLTNALRRLRETPQEIFWADAICINQNDLDERGQQVQLMLDIYSGAELVYSYLNDDESMTKAELIRVEAAVMDADDSWEAMLCDEAEAGDRHEGEDRRRASVPVGLLDPPGRNIQDSHVDPFAALDLAVRRVPRIGYGEKEDGVSDTGQDLVTPESQDPVNQEEQTSSEEIPATHEPEKTTKPELIQPPIELADSSVDLGLFWCNIISEQLKASEVLEGSSLPAIQQAARGSDRMHVLVNDAIPPVLRLMRNRSWRRVWVFQEMVLAEDQMFLGRHTSIARSDFEFVCQWLRKVGDGDVLRPRFVEHETWSAWKKQIQTTTMQSLTLKRCRALADKIDRAKPKNTLTGPRNELFNWSEDLEATDPRDHIYGIMGVLDVRFKPDYHRSVKQLYCMWANWLTYAGPEASFRFLRRAGIGQNAENQHDLPSWVPDWSSSSNCGYPSIGVRAAMGLKCDMRIVANSTLFLDGVVVGTIAPRRKQGKNMFLQIYLHLLANGHPTGDPPLQVLYRVLTRDNWPGCQDGNYDPHDPKLLGAFLSFASLLTSSDDQAFTLLDIRPLLWSPVSWALNEYFGLQPGAGDRWNPLKCLYSEDPDTLTTGDEIIDSLMSSLFDVNDAAIEILGNEDHTLAHLMTHTSLFRTTNGYIGSSSTVVQAGDLVCVLVGCPNTVVLRKVQDHYIVVEPCFVHRLMYGEVVQLVAEGRCEPQQTFEIR
ncbi:hypothetical protein B0A55_08565 [Friedmanniomyces simplex]|uniref:Heterokaryon incompatibility domain-containing protein n=1 Tax=Friedmanniomyces simplex TaxID=329884 RepID=A0A4U0WRR6_9PEZI|nr:hypothetical protein B0A55_08565 [Friedmanniomyces simplex]